MKTADEIVKVFIDHGWTGCRMNRFRGGETSFCAVGCLVADRYPHVLRGWDFEGVDIDEVVEGCGACMSRGYERQGRFTAHVDFAWSIYPFKRPLCLLSYNTGKEVYKKLKNKNMITFEIS